MKFALSLNLKTNIIRKYHRPFITLFSAYNNPTKLIYFIITISMQSKYQIQQAIEAFCHTFSSLKSHKNIRYSDLCDGFIFVEILKSAPLINISPDELDETEGKWILKLGNLKKIITRLETYCTAKLKKTLLSNDIDLIQVSKNHSPQQIVKFFQLVLATLMQSPYKQDYIEKIMSLDQKSQSLFVSIIQNALDCRITSIRNHEVGEYEDQIKLLKQENQHLREEMSFFTRNNKNLVKEVDELKEKLKQQAQELETMRYAQIQKTNQSLTLQLTQQRNLTQNLKTKLINIARSHEIEISKYQQQISIYQLKLQHLQQLENNLEMYKERYTETLKETYKKDELEKQKRKLTKELEEKQLVIKKLNQRIEQYQQKRQNMQQNELHMKMQLQKKQVRFKMLQKQVRNRLQQTNTPINSPTLPSTILQQSLDDQRLQNHQQEMQFLKSEIQKLQNTNRELQRETLKNKKKLEKLGQLEKDKKKLERMILDVSKSRDAEIEMLVVSLWELRNQNVKIFELLKQKNDQTF